MVACKKPYRLPLRLTLSNWSVAGRLIICVQAVTKQISITLCSDPLHDFKIKSNFDVLKQAGNSVRKAVTEQIHDGVAQFVSVPQTFNIG